MNREEADMFNADIIAERAWSRCVQAARDIREITTTWHQLPSNEFQAARDDLCDRAEVRFIEAHRKLIEAKEAYDAAKKAGAKHE